jgi:hypothetical protein
MNDPAGETKRLAGWKIHQSPQFWRIGGGLYRPSAIFHLLEELPARVSLQYGGQRGAVSSILPLPHPHPFLII